MRPQLYALALQCSIAVVAACHGGGQDTCTADDQCASHFCRADNTCGPAAADAPMHSSDGAADGGAALCAPTHDGTITAAELPFAAGKMANYLIATSATW